MQTDLLKETAITADLIGVQNTINALKLLRNNGDKTELLITKGIIDITRKYYNVEIFKLKRDYKGQDDFVKNTLCLISYFIKKKLNKPLREIGEVLDNRSKQCVSSYITYIKSLDSNFKKDIQLLSDISTIETQITEFIKSI